MLHAVQISTVLISHNTFKNHRMKVELFPFYGEKRWGSEKLNHHVNVRKLVSGRQSISLQSPPSFTCEAIWMYLVHGKKKKKKASGCISYSNHAPTILFISSANVWVWGCTFQSSPPHHSHRCVHQLKRPDMEKDTNKIVWTGIKHKTVTHEITYL